MGKSFFMSVRKTVTSTMSRQVAPASSSTSRTFSNTASHCVSMSSLTTLPEASSVTPGISLLPRTRGPIPDRNKSSPTRLACGNAPTGSGARSLLKVSFIAYLLPDWMDSGNAHFRLAQKRNLVIRWFSRSHCRGILVRRAEACYGRQDFPEGGAVNVPNSKKEPADDRSDDESDGTKEEQSAKGTDQDEKVRHFRVSADKHWPQEIIDSAHHSGAPRRQQRCR